MTEEIIYDLFKRVDVLIECVEELLDEIESHKKMHERAEKKRETIIQEYEKNRNACVEEINRRNQYINQVLSDLANEN